MSEHDPHKRNHFFVDGKKYETDQTALTGAQIKQVAGVDPAYQLFLEEKGNAPDRAISDGESVSVEKEPRHFYAVPPATFGER